MSENLLHRLRRIEGAMAREASAARMLKLGRLWVRLLARLRRNHA